MAESQRSDIINELINNDFLENVNINYKLDMMLRSINVIISTINDDLTKWVIKYNGSSPGENDNKYYSIGVKYLKEGLESAENAKKNLMYIDIHDNSVCSMNHRIHMYNEEIRHIVRINNMLRDISVRITDDDVESYTEISIDSDNDMSD